MNYILDIDGTVLDGQKLSLGAKELISRLDSSEIPYLFMTNAVASPASAAERMARAGLVVDSAKILNPLVAINQYLKDRGISRVFAVGGQADIQQLDAVADEWNPGAVVLIDFERINADYSLLQKVFGLAQRGIPVVSASGSRFYLKDGTRRIDTGAFVALFDSLAESPAVVLGKPSREFFEVARSRLGCTAEELTVIGDDWSTDIAGALDFGAKAVLIRSGKYVPGDENRRPEARCVGSFREIEVGR